jgi:hypothetical protein
MQVEYARRRKQAAHDLADRGLRGHHANRHLPKSPAPQQPNSALGRVKQLQSGGIRRESTTWQATTNGGVTGFVPKSAVGQ